MDSPHKSSDPLSSLGAALSPSKCPRKPEPHQATNGRCPVIAPPSRLFLLMPPPTLAPVLHPSPSQGPGAPSVTPPALHCPALPHTCALIIMAPLQTPQDTGQSLRRGPVINIQVMKSKSLQPRLFYPARFSFKMESEIWSFPEKRKLKEYTSTKAALQDMLKGLF